MFCPKCKSEYRDGFTECSDCGTLLVDKLERDPANQDLALAWRGSDPAGFSAAKAALDGGGIRNFPIGDHDQLAWGLAIARPRYGLLVRKSDLEAALDLVASIQERSPLAYAKDIWKSGATAPESEQVSSDEDHASDDIAEAIDPKKATSEIWWGEAATAGNLRLCLRENGIPCAIDVVGDVTKLRVLPEHEARAKEIIREVTEATSPE
jgi:hypothetical protein